MNYVESFYSSLLRAPGKGILDEVYVIVSSFRIRTELGYKLCIRGMKSARMSEFSLIPYV